MEQLKLDLSGPPVETEEQKFEFWFTFALEFCQWNVLQSAVNQYPHNIFRMLESQKSAGQMALQIAMTRNHVVMSDEFFHKLEDVVAQEGSNADLLNFARLPDARVHRLQNQFSSSKSNSESNFRHILTEFARIPASNPEKLIEVAEAHHYSDVIVEICRMAPNSSRNAAKALARLKDTYQLWAAIGQGIITLQVAEDAVSESTDWDFVISFARSVPGVNVRRLEDILLSHGLNQWTTKFRNQVPGAQSIADLETVIEVLEP